MFLIQYNKKSFVNIEDISSICRSDSWHLCFTVRGEQLIIEREFQESFLDNLRLINKSSKSLLSLRERNL